MMMERIKEEWVPTRQAEFEALNEDFISNKEILDNIKEAEETARMNLEQYKKAITERKVKNYSIVQLKMWEEMEQLKKERKL